MKEFLETMMKDYQQENFTTREWVIYGIVAPATLIVACLIF